MRRRRLRACFRSPVVLAAAWSLGCVALTVGTSQAAVAAPGDCLVLAESFLPDAADHSDQPPRPSPDMKRPISEAEVKALIEALEPVPLKLGEGVAIRAAAEGKSALPTDRFGVVVGDAVTLLAMLHARETLDVLGKARLTPGQRQTFEKDFRRVLGCGEARFAGRGDASIVKTSLELVRKHRGELEPLLLDKLQPRRDGKGGPR